MNTYYIRIQLQSETIFGSGLSVPGSVDLEVLHDQNGLPYMKAKTIKGKLREEIEAIVDSIKAINLNQYQHYYKIVEKMFGQSFSNEEKKEKSSSIYFSNCTIDPQVRLAVEQAVQQRVISSYEVLNGMTEQRYFIQVNENGVAEDGSLRQIRVIKPGFVFITPLYCSQDINKEALELLACGASSLRYLGSMESRGKGSVVCSLYENDTDITQEYVDTFVNKVVKSA